MSRAKELLAKVQAQRKVEKLPPFRYKIDSLRVDGDQSADPRDYAGWPRDKPVGDALHAFLTAELNRKLLPSHQRGFLRWSLSTSRVLAINPTLEDLEKWAKAKYALYRGCAGTPLAIER